MSKKHKHQPGFTKQNIRDLSYIKAPSRGIRLSLPPFDRTDCNHLGSVVEDYTTGALTCTKCKQSF